MKYTYDYKNLCYVEYREKFILLKYLSLVGLCVIMFFLGTTAIGNETYFDLVYTKPATVKFSQKNLKNKLIVLGVNHVDIVLQQAKHETGNFQSELFLKGNNLFGMKVARVRPRLQKGTYTIGTEKYASYNNWEESVIDYCMWQMSQCRNIYSDSMYYSYLGNHYATDQKYVKKLKKIKL